MLDSVAALSGGAVDKTVFGQPHFLFTLPNAPAWFVPPNIWHLDVPRLACSTQLGVQLFAFLDKVEPQGGGTLVVAGSHRLLNSGCFIRSKDVKRRLAREDFFRTLFCPQEDRASVLGVSGRVGDVEVEVVELTGTPGDAYLMDLGVLHAPSPNASERPRMMMTHRFVRVECAAELSKWTG